MDYHAIQTHEYVMDNIKNLLTGATNGNFRISHREMRKEWDSLTL